MSELRRLLARPDTRVIRRRLRVCGQSTWNDEGGVSDITIYLDPRRDGHVRLVIHELLHVYMAQHLSIGKRMVYEVEEAAILAWERLLYDYLHAAKREKLLESWSQAIARKLS